MYVLVRKDLSEIYRGVQGGHALAQYSLYGDKELFEKWNNGTLVYLGVPNEKVLGLWMQKLIDKHKEFTFFREPDLGDQITSIACIDTGEVFKKLPLA